MGNMFMSNDFAENVKALGARGVQNINIASTGTITSVDPVNYLAKVMLGVSGVETGWLPIGTMIAGAGYGVIAIPDIGTEVTVIFDEGNLQTGKIVLSNFNDVDKPPQGMNPGEILVQAKSGAKIKLDKSGHIVLNGGTKGIARIGDSVDMNPNSSTYGQIVSGNSNILA